MINEKDVLIMPKAARVSYLKSAVTAHTAYIASLSPGGEYNDAVLELNRLNYMLTNANLALK